MNGPAWCVGDAAAAIVTIAGSVDAGGTAGNRPPLTTVVFAQALVLLGMLADDAAWVILLLRTPESRGRADKSSQDVLYLPVEAYKPTLHLDRAETPCMSVTCPGWVGGLDQGSCTNSNCVM